MVSMKKDGGRSDRKHYVSDKEKKVNRSKERILMKRVGMSIPCGAQE